MRFARAFLASSFFVFVTASAAHAQVYGLQFVSQAGDSIGHGQTYSLTPAPSAVIVQSYGPGNTIDVAIIGNGNWSFEISSADAQPLVVGSYPSAERGFGASPGHPALDFGGDGRGCNRAYGQFNIVELERGASNTVTRLAVDFIQHCEGFEPALYGSIRVNSTQPMPPAPALPDYPPAFLQLISQPGDYVGGGSSAGVRVDRTLTRPNLFQLTDDGFFNGVQVNIGPAEGVGEFWSLTFLPPSGQQLVPGNYTGGVNVGGDGRGCSGSGKFTVLEIAHGPLNSFSKLAVDFEQRCDGSAAALYGSLRYNSSVPYTPPTLAPLATRVGFPDSTRMFTVAPNTTIDSIRLTTIDDAGTLVGNTRVSISAGCGRFSNGNPFIDVDSDAGGIVHVPVWTAPVTAGDCNFSARLASPPSSPVEFTVRVVPTTPQANSVAFVDATHDFQVLRNTSFNGLRVATIAAATGARIPNTEIRAEASCGDFGGVSNILRWSSDTTGIATLPAWRAPSGLETSCTITVSLWTQPQPSLVFTMQVTPPAPSRGPATQVQIADGVAAQYNVAAGASFSGLRVATLDATGSRIGGYTVRADASCGAFNGSAAPGLAFATADASGIAVIPAWQAPSAGTPQCMITVSLDGFPTASVTFTMQVTQGGGPPPPPATRISSRTGASPAGGSVNFSIASAPGGTCTIADFSVLNPAATDLFNFPPASLAYAKHGYVDFRLDGCVARENVTFTIEFPEALPPTAQWWKLGFTKDNPTNHWYPIPSTIDGNRITFTIADGGLGDDDITVNGSIRDLGMLGIEGGTMQDLWWSGIAENGWGMTLVQHRDVLFGNMFVYDANGAPTWYVMPSGSWDTAHKVYTGDLYLPKSSPYFAYDVSKFDVGASVGTAKITFNGVNDATFEYTINGISARKNISRIPFGPVAPPTDKPMGDLWWAGLAQNGWGLVLSQQYATLFGLWFTYDANGKATWFVMPNVEFVSKDNFRGNIYRPEGPPWLGVTYDPSRHRTVQVGTFTLRFSGEGATFDYSIEGKSGSIPISRIPF